MCRKYGKISSPFYSVVLLLSSCEDIQYDKYSHYSSLISVFHKGFSYHKNQCSGSVSFLTSRLRILTSRSKKIKKNLDFYSFVIMLMLSSLKTQSRYQTNKLKAPEKREGTAESGGGSVIQWYESADPDQYISKRHRSGALIKAGFPTTWV